MSVGIHPLASVIAAVAWRRRSLSSSGAFAAAGVGSVIFAGGGPVWFATLGAFFVTSTLLGRVGAAMKERTKREFSKGDTRDAYQVLANGGVAAVAAALMYVAPDARWLYAFAGALATANGDTWATELGVTICGQVLVHMLCVFVLPYSNWQWATVCLTEALGSLRRGVQAALFELGRVPTHRDDGTSALVANRKRLTEPAPDSGEPPCWHDERERRLVTPGRDFRERGHICWSQQESDIARIDRGRFDPHNDLVVARIGNLDPFE